MKYVFSLIAASICIYFIFYRKWSKRASQNFYPSSSKCLTVKWILSYYGPQNELSRVYTLFPGIYFANTTRVVPYFYYLFKKLQSLNEKPLKSLLIIYGNYFPFLWSCESWLPYMKAFFLTEWAWRSQKNTTYPI